MDYYALEANIEAFKTLAKERMPDALWSSLHDCIIGMLSVHLLGRLAFRLFVQIKELEQRVAKLEGKL